MASIVVCRYCRASLGEPTDGGWGARLECPVCHGQFDAPPESIVPLRPAIAVGRIAPAPAPAEAGVVVMPRSLKGSLVGARSSLEGLETPTPGDPGPRTPLATPPLQELTETEGPWTSRLVAKLQEAWNRVRSPGDDVDSLWQRSSERFRRPQTWGVALGAALAVVVGALALRPSPADDGANPAEQASLTPQADALPARINQEDAASGSNRDDSLEATSPGTDGGTGAETEQATADLPTPIEEPAGAPLAVRSAEEEKKTRWPVTPLVGALRHPQLVGMEDLRSAHERAERIRELFLEGDLTDSRRVSQKGQAYKTLCELAYALTMQGPTDMSLDFATQQALGTELLRNAAMDENHRAILSQIAARWWEYAGRSTPGIFFVGNVESIDAVGPWTLYSVHASWEGGGVKIPVLGDTLRFSTGTDALFIGVVVNQPNEELEGYDLPTPQLVLAGYALRAVETAIRPRRAFGLTNDLLRDSPTN